MIIVFTNNELHAQLATLMIVGAARFIPAPTGVDTDPAERSSDRTISSVHAG